KIAQAGQVGGGPEHRIDRRQVIGEPGDVAGVVPARGVRAEETAAEDEVARAEVCLPDRRETVPRRRVFLPRGQEAAEGVGGGEEVGDRSGAVEQDLTGQESPEVAIKGDGAATDLRQ